MKIALLSDIHGNLEAFLAVLQDIQEKGGVDKIYCLGDAVGYGPDPEAVIQILIEHKISMVMGNHELAIIKAENLEWFNPLARKSIHKTIKMLSDESIDYIHKLPTFLSNHNARFVHGFPPDYIKTYLFQATETCLIETFAEMKEYIAFVGHTHDLELIWCEDQKIDFAPLAEESVDLLRTRKYIINIGSVGQPRDGDNHSKYVIWDIYKSQIEVRFVPYDIESVVEKILARGLPKEHAHRLR